MTYEIPAPRIMIIPIFLYLVSWTFRKIQTGKTANERSAKALKAKGNVNAA
jgi:hypothetical protein